MIEDWSCLSQQDTTPYTEICAEAVENDEVFARFKQDPRYTAILEHVPPEHGEEYVDSIQAYELSSELIEEFKENDSIGGANLVEYDKPFGRISPSTLRYIQNALDISYFFGEGELNKIVEIGGGYGGLCKTISCLCDFDEYHIYDIEPASKLQKKYLDKFGIEVVHHNIPEEIKDVDLLISNYAYSELGEKLQDLYYNNVIINAKKVYMILNRGQVSREVLLKRAQKDFVIKLEKVLDFWPPNGYLYYTTMTRR